MAAKKLKITKQNDTMAFITLEDMTGSMEMLVFPKVLALYSALLREGEAVAVTGRLSTREDEEPKLICEKVARPEELFTPEEAAGRSAAGKRTGLFLLCPAMEDPRTAEVRELLAAFPVKRRFTSGSGTAANCCLPPKISGPTSPSRCCAGCVLSWERTAWSIAHSGPYICKSQKRQCSG